MTPRFEFLMSLAVDVGDVMSMGSGPLGERRVIGILGGTFEGPGMRGEVLPGGADWQIIRKDGVLDLDARRAEGAGRRAHPRGQPGLPAGIARGPRGPGARRGRGPGQVFLPDYHALRDRRAVPRPLNKTIAVATAERKAKHVLLSAYKLL